jgi:hypothetical protein
MKKLKIVQGLLAVFITLPLWFVLLYRLLDSTEANELTWFLYWVYVPVATLVNGIGRIFEDE